MTLSDTQWRNIAVASAIVLMLLFGLFVNRGNVRLPPPNGPVGLELARMIEDLVGAAGGAVQKGSCGMAVKQRHITVQCRVVELRRGRLKQHMLRDGWVLDRVTSVSAYPEVVTYLRSHDNLDLSGDGSGNIQVVGILRTFPSR